MAVSMTCRRCKVEIEAQDEDQLVERVQEHVQGHAGKHPRMHSGHMSREHILKRLRLQQKRAAQGEHEECG